MHRTRNRPPSSDGELGGKFTDLGCRQCLLWGRRFCTRICLLKALRAFRWLFLKPAVPGKCYLGGLRRHKGDQKDFREALLGTWGRPRVPLGGLWVRCGPAKTWEMRRYTRRRMYPPKTHVFSVGYHGLTWALLGSLWALLGLCWARLGSPGALLGLSWGSLGPSWAPLGLSWGSPGLS